jgi:hypothetical protein
VWRLWWDWASFDAEGVLMTADLPAEAVEPAARALHLNDCRSTGHDEGDCWGEAEKWERAVYLSNATAALTAAVPSLREAWETELREHSSDRVGDLLTDIARITRGSRDV